MMRNALCIIFGLMLGANLNTRNDNVTLYTHFTVSPDVWESNGTYWITLRIKTQSSPLNTEKFDSPTPVDIFSANSSPSDAALEPCWPALKEHDNNKMRHIVTQNQKISYLFHKCVKRKCKVDKVAVLETNTVDKIDLLNVHPPDVAFEILIPLLEEKNALIGDKWELTSDDDTLIGDEDDLISFNEIIRDFLHDIPVNCKQVAKLGVSLVLPLICIVLCSGFVQHRKPLDLVAGFNIILNFISDVLKITEDIRSKQTGMSYLMDQQYQKYYDHMNAIMMDVLLLKDEIYSKNKNAEETLLFKYIEMESRIGVMCKSYVKWKEFDKLKALIDLTNRSILDEKMMLQKFLIDSLCYLDDCVKTESQTSDLKKKLQYLKMAQSILHTNYHLLVMGLSSEHMYRSSGDTVFNPLSEAFAIMGKQLEAYSCIHSKDHSQKATAVTVAATPSKKIWIGGKWFKQSGACSVDLYPTELMRNRSYTGSELNIEASPKGEYVTRSHSMSTISQGNPYKSM